MKYRFSCFFPALASALILTACNSQNSALSNLVLFTSPAGGGTSTSLLDAEESAFVTLINDYRAQNGLVVLQLSKTLVASSKWLSEDMAAKNYFTHTDSLGRDPGTRMVDFGYPSAAAWGENIAAGNAAAQDTFTQWKNSPAHNANMLDSSYQAMGVGRAYSSGSDYGWYWTTDFGSVVDAPL